MSSWRDVAAAVSQRQQPASELTAVENVGLPDDLATALRRLETLQPPRKLERAENWRGVVADAMTLARHRWAAKAMALGWVDGRRRVRDRPARRLGLPGARGLARRAPDRHA